MKKFNLFFCLLILTLSIASCSKEESNDLSVLGTWQLTTWTVNIPIDLNNDTITSNNLLDESVCENNELLIFEANGTVSSSASFNPSVTISLLDIATDEYMFDVQCDIDGSISLAGMYSQNENEVILFETTAVIVGNELTVMFENAVDIYNEDLTEIVAAKNLILIYTKK